jgi:hypothetical protein
MEKQLFKINNNLYFKKYLAVNCVGKEILVLENTENQKLIHIPATELPAPYVPNYVNIKAGQYFVFDGKVHYNSEDRTFDLAGGHIILDTEGNPVQEGKAYKSCVHVVVPSQRNLLTLGATSIMTDSLLDPNVKVSALSGQLLVDPVWVSHLGCKFPCNKGEEGITQSTISGNWYLTRDVANFREGAVIVSKEDIENGLTSEYFVCDCCGDIHHVNSARDAYDDSVICENCCDDQYVWSEAMNAYIYSDDAFYYKDDDEYYDSPVHYECKSQYGWQSDATGNWWSDNEERLETEDGYHYADGEQDDLYWCDTDEGWYCHESNMPESLIRGYHKRPTLKFFGEGPKFLGLELECDDPSADGDESDVRYIFDGHMDRFYFNSDGSLDNGFEAITHPMSPKEMLAMNWEEITRRMQQRNYYNDGDTAGIHIHVSRNFFHGEKNIGRLVRMFSENYSDMVKFAQRPRYSAERWADRVQGTSRQYATDWYYNARRFGRYTAVNLQNDNTVEIRLFHSLADCKHIKACIQLVDVLSDMANIDRYQFDWSIVSRKAKDKGYEDLQSRLLELNFVEA